MKSYSVFFLLVSYLLSANNLFSQIPDSITLTYSTYFAFEDAIGNVDTVFIHGKTTGNYLTDPGYEGESLIAEPFDDEFEVRLGDGDGNYQIPGENNVSPVHSYKRYFTPAYPGNSENCNATPYGGNIYFLVKARNWPIRVTWDPSANDPSGNVWPCKTGMVLVDNRLHEVTNNNWYLDNSMGVHQYACLYGATEGWTFEYIDDILRNGFSTYAIHPEGQPLHRDTIRLFSTVRTFDVLLDSCIARALTPVWDYDDSPTTNLSSQVTAYPNPVGGERLQLDLSPFAGARRLYLSAYNAAGVETGSWSYFDQDLGAPLPLDTENWPPGLHYLLVVDEQGWHARVKVVRL
ncbi:hypothetical protein CEQ90_01670 [Lewinellaceae bacterium SD302]|nr:hypothetical protein CEQ90_01670 [Lewinellaceae bacterium SD302]